MPIFPTGYTQKTTPADDDQVLIGDSAASNAIKRLKISSIVTKVFTALPTALAALSNWITTAMIQDKAVTSRKMKPSYAYVAGSTGGARQSVGTSWVNIQGATLSYTSGPTTEVLQIWGRCIANATAAGSQFLIGINGTPAGKSDYDDQSGTFKGRFADLLYEIPANTTVTIALMGKAASGTVAVGNAAADVANNYSPSLGVTAFGR